MLVCLVFASQHSFRSMLLIAGFVEGFISPSQLPAVTKIVLALMLAAAFTAYILRFADPAGATADSPLGGFDRNGPKPSQGH